MFTCCQVSCPPDWERSYPRKVYSCMSDSVEHRIAGLPPPTETSSAANGAGGWGFSKRD